MVFGDHQIDADKVPNAEHDDDGTFRNRIISLAHLSYSDTNPDYAVSLPLALQPRFQKLSFDVFLASIGVAARPKGYSSKSVLLIIRRCSSRA